MLSEFMEKYIKKENPIKKEAQMLFDVWKRIKCDVDSNEDTKVSDDLPNFREETLEFPFPEFNHVTAENSSTADNCSHDLSWICKTIDNEAIQLFDESNLINQIDKNFEMSDLPNDQTSDILTDQIDQTFNNLENGTKPVISKDNTSEIKKTKESNIDIAIDFKHFNSNVQATHKSNCDDSTESKISASKTDEQKMVCEYQVNEEKNKENINSKPKKINILSNILVIPQPKSNQPAKKRNYTSSVLTSASWIENEEKKEHLKLDALKKKEENKKKRAENKQKRIEQQSKKKKHHAEFKQIKKGYEQDEIYQDLDTNHTSPSPILGNSGNKLVNKKPETQKGQEKDIDQAMSDNQESFKENTHVIVKYENNFYPGKITKIVDDGYFVSTMTKTLNHWKWPEKIDEICYKNDEIVRIIDAPQKINSRGVFSVSEMLEYIVH